MREKEIMEKEMMEKDKIQKDKIREKLLVEMESLQKRFMLEGTNFEREEAKSALQEIEKRFAELFDKAPLGYQSLDEEGRFIEVNQAWLETLGYSREEVIGHLFVEFLVPEFRDVFHERFRLFKINGKVQTEFQMLHKNGEKRDIYFNGCIGHWPDGSFRQTHCTLADITERKKMEVALKESELSYRRLFETAQDGIFILDFETGIINDVNPFLVNMLGYSRDELRAKHLWEVGFFKDEAASRESFSELQTKGYIRFEDLPLRTKSGKSIQVEFVSNVYLVGSCKVIQCNIRDVTDRKRMEKELAQAKENQFRTLIESLPQKVFLKDRNSVYVSCNENYANDLRIKPEEIAGKTDYDFFPAPLAEKAMADDKRIMESGKMESREEEYHLMKDLLEGSQKTYIEVVKAPVRDKAGNVTGLFGLFWDITEQKRAVEEEKRVDALEAVADTKSKFATMVSHELRSPLAVIKEALDIVLDGLTGMINDEQKDVLETAKKSTDRLNRLINNVLDFKKIEAGKLELDFRENDLNEVVTGVIEGMRVLSKRKGLDLKMELEEGLPKIIFDKDKIIQVLTNLVSNAIHSTEKGSVILVTKKENNFVHIRVQDTGKGILAEGLRKLFIPFERISDVKEQRTGGTGLGLAISKELVLAHKGKIWAESVIGKGTTFHFTLPV